MQVFLLAFYGALFLFLLIVVIRYVRVVPQGYAGVIERLGRFHKVASPGLVYLMPFIDRIRYVSLKEQVDEYKPQPVITSDNVTVTIDAILYFQIIDPARSLYEVEDYFVALELLTMTTLRDIIGEMTLDECLTSRERINARLRGVLDDATGKWGIKVTRVEIRTIQPPAEIQSAMEKQMKAERDKRAAILEAEGVKQSRILKAEGEKRARILEAEGEKEAAVLRAEGRAQAYKNLFGALKEIGIDDKVIAVRYLEALEKVADGKATKLILPIEATGILGALAGIAEAAKKKESW
jgi:regulator of protease activity HflC (stomatin/prohibitin superfamily)